MRFEHNSISLWLAPGTDALGETVQAGHDVNVTVAVEPADASNRVELRYRINGGPTEKVRAKPVRHAAETQYFRAVLPASLLRLGDMVEYVPVCRCVSRQVPTEDEANRFGASFRVIDAKSSVSALPGSTPAAGTAPLKSAAAGMAMSQPMKRAALDREEPPRQPPSVRVSAPHTCAPSPALSSRI